MSSRLKYSKETIFVRLLLYGIHFLTYLRDILLRLFENVETKQWLSRVELVQRYIDHHDRNLTEDEIRAMEFFEHIVQRILYHYDGKLTDLELKEEWSPMLKYSRETLFVRLFSHSIYSFTHLLGILYCTQLLTYLRSILLRLFEYVKTRQRLSRVKPVVAKQQISRTNRIRRRRIPTHHKNMTEDEKRAVKIFENTYLVERILDRYDGKLTNLNLRLVNKTFYNTCLRILRTKNRSMKIEFLQRERGLTKDTCIVHVNDKPMKLAELPFYFSFLNKVARLKVERIEVVNVWKLRLFPETLPLAELFHDHVIWGLIGKNRDHLKGLIGWTAACDSCNYCSYMRFFDVCQEYGPINIITLYRRAHRYERLILKDTAIEVIAIACTRKSNSKEACLKILEKNISLSNITCTTLAIWLSERRRNDERIISHTLIPREVLQMMLRQWKVKNVELKLIYSEQEGRTNLWLESGYFTGFRFNDSFESMKKMHANPKIEHVHVDLSLSVDCAGDLKMHVEMRFENLIANVRRVFNTDQISIEFSHWSYVDSRNHSVSEFLDKMCRMSRMDAHRNLTVNINFYTRLERQDNVQFINDEIVFDIPDQFEIVGPRIHSMRKTMNMINYPFENEKWIGVRCRFVDSDKNFTLNVQINLKEKDVEEAISQHVQTKMIMRMFELDPFDY